MQKTPQKNSWIVPLKVSPRSGSERNCGQTGSNPIERNYSHTQRVLTGGTVILKTVSASCLSGYLNKSYLPKVLKLVQ